MSDRAQVDADLHYLLEALLWATFEALPAREYRAKGCLAQDSGDLLTFAPLNLDPAEPVERLFPFVLRSRNLLVGRETLRRNKRRLHFVLITRDLSGQSRAEVLSDFARYPVVQHYTSEELEHSFLVKGTEVIGFEKSGLAQSVYAELKQYRLNKPAKP